MHKPKGLKLAVSLQLPTEKPEKPCIFERVQDCLDEIEFGSTTAAPYNFLRKLNNKLVERWELGKRCPKTKKLLGMITPLMLEHGLMDNRGIKIAEEFIADVNPSNQEEC